MDKSLIFENSIIYETKTGRKFKYLMSCQDKNVYEWMGAPEWAVDSNSNNFMADDDWDGDMVADYLDTIEQPNLTPETIELAPLSQTAQNMSRDTTATGMKLSKIMIQIYAQSHYWHWETKSYAQHMAFSDLYNEIISLNDSFTETYQGIFGKYCMDMNLNEFALFCDPTIACQILSNFILEIKTCYNAISETSLLNILDEIVGTLQLTCDKLSRN